MKKLLIYLLLLLPLLAFSQAEPVLLRDFYKKIPNIEIFKFNDEVSIMYVETNNKNFEILGINEQMKVLWQVKLKGHFLDCGKFKDMIVAVATTDYSSYYGHTNNIYKGVAIDPLTGKILLDKIIYSSDEKIVEHTKVYFGAEGSNLKIVVAKTALRKVSWSLRQGEQESTTTELLVMDVDKDLNVDKIIKPVIPNGKLFSQGFDKSGDFVMVHNTAGLDIDVTKYSMDNNAPVASYKIKFDIPKDIELKDIGKRLTIAYSPNNDVVYLGLMQPLGEEQKKKAQDMLLTLKKIDLGSGLIQTVTELFDENRIGQIIAGFKSVNPKIDKPTFFLSKDLDVFEIVEINGKLLLNVKNAVGYTNYRSFIFWTSSAPLIICYDFNLKKQYEQLIPATNGWGRGNGDSFKVLNNKLIIMSSSNNGPQKVNAFYTIMDFESGKLEQMDWIVNKKVGKYDFVIAKSVMWFKNYHIFPYITDPYIDDSRFSLNLLQIKN